MADVACDILFLADRLWGRDDLQSLKGLFPRLECLGHSWSLICRSTDPEHGLADLTECPDLGRRWRRPWAIRGLGLGGERDRPRLMHVLSTSMADAALEIAERWQLPYLLCVDEFPRPDTRLRLSRSWCRGLVGSNRELAVALGRDLGVNLRSIHPIVRAVHDPASPDRPSRSGRVPVIGAAGPLVPGSGFSTFLNAARKLVDAGIDAEFLIAGQGEDEGDLRRRAQRLRIADRLTFADEVPAGLDFRDVLDIYCQTSVIPTVGRPLTLAMAAGVPSIATDVEGLRSLVVDGSTGLIVPHGDSTALARSIAGLLADRARSEQLGRAGREAVRRACHPDREAERLDALYRGIVRAGLGPQDSGLASRIDGLDAGEAFDAARILGESRAAVVPCSGLEA
jgi:glycosyltransferase involved in cell wall biosynthesis